MVLEEKPVSCPVLSGTWLQDYFSFVFLFVCFWGWEYTGVTVEVGERGGGKEWFNLVYLT